MKKIALKFTYCIDLINVPDRIAKNIQGIRASFDKWLYDKSNNHNYWIYVDGKKKAVSFDSSAFVCYINTVHLHNEKEKAYVFQENVESIPYDIPTLFF